MEYFVAPTYENYERIGEPFLNDHGKMVTKARCKCDRCVDGTYIQRVENGMLIPHPYYSGICLACHGTGYITKVIRLYTKNEHNALMKRKEQEDKKKEEKMRETAEKKKNEWLAAHGFNEEGYTYILIGLDSYAIKEQLKETGWVYDPYLRWHRNAPGIYDNNVHKMHWSEGFTFSAWGDAYPIEGIQAKVDTLIEAAKPASTSKWFGVEGERFSKLPVILVSVHGFMGKFGYSQIVKFKTAEGDVLNWFTAVEISIEPGQECFLSGTIKKHDNYNNEQVTTVTRCKIKEIDND